MKQYSNKTYSREQEVKDAADNCNVGNAYGTRLAGTVVNVMEIIQPKMNSNAICIRLVWFMAHSTRISCSCNCFGWTSSWELDPMDLQRSMLHLTRPEKFAKEYLSHLLPSLKKVQGRLEEKRAERSAEQIIKFEVDMALALSAKNFRWGRALGHKLRAENAQRTEESRPLRHSLQMTRKLKNKYVKVTNTKSAPNVCKSSTVRCKFSNKMRSSLQKNTTSRNNIWEHNNKRCLVMAHQKLEMKHKFRELSNTKRKADIDGRIEALACIVPGGIGMDTSILFEECASYIECLKMQVRILQELTLTQCACHMEVLDLP